ncbi:MAG: ABC transporter ATP-binding protein [Erysipelothrix sp.]|nr:ABC transporter ATP-binding protein [Erysipelothrix sp.]
MKLKLMNVSRTFGIGEEKIDAIKNINFTFDKGEQIMIVGKSGAGKSTLLNILGLLDSGFTGDYIINDKNVKDLNHRQLAQLRNEYFGFVFQEYVLIEDESVYKNVEVPLRYSSRKKKDYKALVLEALKEVELEKLAEKNVNLLSGGERQRVAIARALVNKPKIIIADEPTGSLDADTRKSVLDIIYQYISDEHILIFVTHDLENNKRGSQQIMIIDQGNLSDM